MFKITPRTIHRFSLAEILLMAAMNELEAKERLRPRCAIPNGLARSGSVR
jgi:hypothetical protein